MAATIRGTQILQFGTIVTSGYITEAYSQDIKGEDQKIQNETGDFVTDISGFGIMTEHTVEVIPLSSTTEPAIGSVVTIGTGGSQVLFILKSIASKQMNKDAVKWTLKGESFPDISLS